MFANFANNIDTCCIMELSTQWRMTMEKKKNTFWSWQLDNIEECEKFINEAHWFLIAMAVIMCLGGIFLKQFWILLPDVIIMCIFAFLLKKYQSRTVSILILLYSIGITISTFGNKLNLAYAQGGSGGRNVFLALIFVYVAIKSVQATFKLFKLKNFAVSWKNFIIKTIIFAPLLLIFGFIALVCCAIFQNDMLCGSIMFFAMFLAAFVAYAGVFPMSHKLKIKYPKYIDEQNIAELQA